MEQGTIAIGGSSQLLQYRSLQNTGMPAGLGSVKLLKHTRPPPQDPMPMCLPVCCLEGYFSAPSRLNSDANSILQCFLKFVKMIG